MNLENIKLSVGKHSSIEEGACVMELISYLADEPWSDHPKCASASISCFCIWINDKGEQSHRDKLQTLVPKIVNTNDWTKEPARAKIFSEFAFWNKDKAEGFADSAPEYAKYAAEYAEYAAEYAADSAAESAAKYAAEYTAKYAAEYAAKSAAKYAEYAEAAAKSAAKYAAKAAESAEYAGFKIELYDEAIRTLERVLAV